MADTDTETLPNGTGGLSAAEEEDERLKQRPADIDADVREMERRKRVEALMSSKLFREELERVLDQQMNEGADAPLLQRIKEMVGGRLHTGSMRGPSCVLPINDIRGIEGIGYEKGEKILRCKLAAVYRLVDLFGWTQTGQGSQITARLNTAVEQVLTTPRGLLPHELTASSLVKVDMQGIVQDQGTTNFPVNVAGFSVHASVHAARPDIRCVLHIRSPAALAISAMKNGLLPLSTEAALLGDIAYHTVPAGVLDNEERDKMVRVLGPTCKLLFITSNGALCCGETLEEAFYQAKNLTAACEVQLRLASLPLDSLILLDEDTRKQIYDASRKPPVEGAKWRVGGEEFEALMRMLDNAGFRTGYIYRHPLIKNDVPKPKSDVEVPPAVSSLGYLLEEEEMYKQGLWKKGQGKVGERTRWLNSPNVYQKVEVLETGTNDPKKITKWVDANNEEWVQDGSPAHSSTPVKIDTLQFVPMKTNPKEFKALQQQIKDNRRADKISAGPQSHILEGVTWDEANKLNQAAEDASHTHTGDHVVLMGAASKGIIQRGYQHNATVYSAPYARNPFDHVTDSEIDEYRRTVERRQRGGDYDTDLSESEAISAAQITSPVSETEEESRDEHRVLRIETKQAPIRSQPEVVLSDVDTTDFLHAERIHAERTKATPSHPPPPPQELNQDPNLLSDDEVFLDSAASTASSALSPVTSPMTSPPLVVRHHRIAVQQNVVRGTNSPKAPVRPKAPTPKLTPNTALTTNKRTQYAYPRNTNFDTIVKVYDSPESSPLEEKKAHPKCKVSLNSRLVSSNDSVKADALELYQPGHASSRSSLYSIPSLEWDGRNKSEFLFKTRSLPRQGRKVNKARLFRTYSHAGFVNSFVKDPEPLHFHLPRCSSCGATNNSYAWELSKNSIKKQSVELSSSLDNVPRMCIEEMAEEFDVVKVMQKEVPIFKVAEVIKESDNEFVESQEFTEDCYLGDMQSSYSSDNMTVIEKTPAKVDGLREQLEKLSPVDEDTKKVYNKVVIQLKEKFDENHDLHGVEMAAVVNPERPEEVNLENVVSDAGWRSLEVHAEAEEMNIEKMDSMETIHGDYLNFSDDMDFTQAVYESPVKDLVEKDIRDYSVPINFYCEDYGKEDSKKSPRKMREVAKGTILEPILEESKSSYGESSDSNVTQGKESTRISDESCFFLDLLPKETTDRKIISGDYVKSNNVKENGTEQLEVPKETTNEVSKCILEEIIDDIYPQVADTENELKSVSYNILNDICDKAVKASLLKDELSKSAENIKLTSHILETAYVHNKTPDYFVLEEGSDVTTFNIESVTHSTVETAMELYLEEAVCNETEVLEDQESIIDSVYENIFEIFSNDAIRSDSMCLSTDDGAGKSSSDPEIAYDQASQRPAMEPIILLLDSEKIADVQAVGNVVGSTKINFASGQHMGEFDVKNQLTEFNIPETQTSGQSNRIDSTSLSNPKNAEFQIFELTPKGPIAESWENTNEADANETASELAQKITACEVIEPQVISEPQTDLAILSLSSFRGYSLGSTIPETPSFNTTLEFEKYEAVSEVIGLLLAKIEFSEATNIDILRDIEFSKRARNIKLFDSKAEENVTRLVNVGGINEEKPAQESVVMENEKEIYLANVQNLENFTVSNDIYEQNEEESCGQTETSVPSSDQEIFSITTIVQHIDSQIFNLNETEVTDSSQISVTEKIIEAIIYYIFERTYSLIANKVKTSHEKKTKKVITVVDVEDILYTAQPLWAIEEVKESNDQAENQENFIVPDIVKGSEKEIELKNNEETGFLPIKRDKVQNIVAEPLKNKEKHENYLIKHAMSSYVIKDEVKVLDIYERTTNEEENVIDAVSETEIKTELKDKVNFLAESHANEENYTSIAKQEDVTLLFPEKDNIEPDLEIEVDSTENIENINEEKFIDSDEDTSKEELGLDIAFQVDNSLIGDAQDICYPEKNTKDLNFDIAFVHTEESNENTSLGKFIDLDTSFYLTENAETSLDLEAQPDENVLAGSPEINAQLEELTSKASSNANIEECDSNFTDLHNKKREIIPKELETDEIVPESVKSVISSVLDEEVDDQDLRKMLEELRNADNTFVFLEPTEFRGELTLPFSFENMKPVFFNKDDIFDDQRQVLIECVYSILEEILDNITEDCTPYDDNLSTDEELEMPAHYLNETFVQSNTYDESYQEIDIYEDFEQNSTAIAQDIVKDILEKSFRLENSFVNNEMSFGDESRNDSEEDPNVRKWMDETFVLKTHERDEDMNTAFVKDYTHYQNSKFSSPVRENSKIFDTCDESPIINTSGGFIGEDLSVLYENEDTISGSPFARRNSVISMSQSFHTGGMKYWVSFDERLIENQERALKGPMKRCSENSIPSFIAINFDGHDTPKDISRASWEEQEVKRTGVLCETVADSKSKSDANKSLYSMVTNDSYHTACASKSDSFKTCEGFRTPVEESGSRPTVPEEIPQKVLLYDTSKDNANTRPYRRQYSSWPPFEETLFYRLISKFRMSESFDPSDLENGDSSL